VEGSLGEILVDVRASNRSSPGPLVVLIHGFKGFKDWGFFPPFAERLARAGFIVVSYNSSGSGVDNEGSFSLPERFGHNTFSADLSDLRSVLAAIHDAAFGLPSPTSIGLVGHSRGGGMAVLGASEDSRIKALVTWAAIASPDRWSAEMRRRWREAGFLEVRNQRTGEVLQLYPDVLDDIERNGKRFDIAAAADRLTIPWLVLHGANDETVPFREAEVLAASAARPELVRIERTGHTFGAVHPFAGMTDPLTRLFDSTVAFLSRHLT
jgi:pimeloyl-ACP methyl ester carboxylesterase